MFVWIDMKTNGNQIFASLNMLYIAGQKQWHTELLLCEILQLVSSYIYNFTFAYTHAFKTCSSRMKQLVLKMCQWKSLLTIFTMQKLIKDYLAIFMYIHNYIPTYVCMYLLTYLYTYIHTFICMYILCLAKYLDECHSYH